MRSRVALGSMNKGGNPARLFLIAGALLALAGCAQSDLEVWEQEQVRLRAEQPQENADRLECLSLAQQIDPPGQVSVPGSVVYVQCMQTKRAQCAGKSD